MTERRPLVIIGGELQELPIGDMLPVGSFFLPVPDEVDQTDATYSYFGWESVNGGWLVQRQLRSDASTLSATTGYTDLAGAWPNRTTLNYT